MKMHNYQWDLREAVIWPEVNYGQGWDVRIIDEDTKVYMKKDE